MSPSLPSNSDAPRRSTVALLAVLVGAGAFLAFIPALDAVFVDFDDQYLLLENDRYRGMSLDHLKWMFTATLMGHYQPLTWVSYAIDYQIAGLNPGQFHLTNVLLHGANAALVFILVLRLAMLGFQGRTGGGPRPWMLLAGAAGAAVFWAVHPLRAESVAWVTERRDVLSGLFLLLAAHAYLCSVEPGKAALRSRGWYGACIGLLLASLLAKSWGMSFFVLMLLVDVWPLRRLPVDPWKWARREYRPVLLQKTPMAAMGLAFMVMAGVAQRTAAGAVRSLEEWPVSSRLAQAAYGLVFYAWKTVSPTDLSPTCELPAVDPLAPGFLACYAAVIVAVVVVVAARRRAPWLAAAAGVYAVTLSPVLGFFQSGDQFVADRYSYLASIPISALLGAGIALALMRLREGPRRLAPAAGLAAVGAWLAAAAWMTPIQASVWKDSLSLWSHAASAAPSGSAHANHAMALERLNRYEEALDVYGRALTLAPENGKVWFALAAMMKKLGNARGAEAAYRQAAKFMPQAFMAYVNLGVLIEPERPQEAIACYRDAIADLHRPQRGSMAQRHVSGLPYLRLGMALEAQGQVEEANAAYRSALEYPDTAAEANSRLGPR